MYRRPSHRRLTSSRILAERSSICLSVSDTTAYRYSNLYVFCGCLRTILERWLYNIDVCICLVLFMVSLYCPSAEQRPAIPLPHVILAFHVSGLLWPHCGDIYSQLVWHGRLSGPGDCFAVWQFYSQEREYCATFNISLIRPDDYYYCYCSLWLFSLPN